MSLRGLVRALLIGRLSGVGRLSGSGSGRLHLGLLHLVSFAGGGVVVEREAALLLALKVSHEGEDKGGNPGEPHEGAQTGNSSPDSLGGREAEGAGFQRAVVDGVGVPIVDRSKVGGDISGTGPSGEPHEHHESLKSQHGNDVVVLLVLSDSDGDDVVSNNDPCEDGLDHVS